MAQRGSCAALAAGIILALSGAEARAAADAAALRELSAKLQQLFSEKKYAEAEVTAARLTKLDPTKPEHPYNLACAQARQGKSDAALRSLAKSINLGYNDAGHMQADEDLASLRAEERFKALAQKARKKGPGARARYEPGRPVPGVKTVERHPEAGLRYRVRMSPAATPEKPDRLIVWLHPSGGSANSIVESLAPRFVKRGFALMVLTQKQFMGWTGPEMTALLNISLPDADKIEGLDARRPLLMGYSAGGQSALSVWPQNSAKFGGMILDAAYPLIPTPGGYRPLVLPKNPGIKECPFFVLVGGNDPGARVWKKTAPEWLAAGVPLVVKYVPGKGHAWLFGAKQLGELDEWLGKVAKGEKPSDEAPPAAEAAKAKPGDARPGKAKPGKAPAGAAEAEENEPPVEKPAPGRMRR